MNKDLAGFIILGFLVLGIAVTLKSCDDQVNAYNLERNSKCFEQTKAKECWGLK